MNNLAKSPEHRETLLRMRKALHDHMVATRDVGILPECEVLARSTDGAPYNIGKRIPLERVIETAEMASMRSPADVKALVKRLSDPDSAVRYWAVLGLRMQGASAVKPARAEIRKLLNDSSPAPKIAAAETLGLYGDEQDLGDVLRVLGDMAPGDRNGAAASILALNAITSLGRKAQPLLGTIKSMNPRDSKSPQRLQEYPTRLGQNADGRFELGGAGFEPAAGFSPAPGHQADRISRNRRPTILCSSPRMIQTEISNFPAPRRWT